MNDTIVISTISKIYFIIVSFISFILLTLFFIFIILQNGIEIKEIDLPSVKIKQLYIKWNEKINISIKDIKIIKNSKKNSKKNSPLTYKKIKHIFTEASLFDSWVETINIDNLAFNDSNASLNFHHLNGGYFNLSNKTQILKSNISIEENYLNIHIDEFSDKAKKLFIHGDIIVSHNMDISASINTKFNNNFSLDINAFANKKNLFYNITSQDKIRNVRDIVNAFNLPKESRFWLTDAIDMAGATIIDTHGWIDYDDISNAYKNIYAKASLDKLNYMYDRKLDPIHTRYTQIEYKNGVLFINPKEAYSYNQYLDKSKLNIDFTGKHEVLTLYLQFDGILNDGMLTILNRYKIKVPFYQHQGKIETNLKLVIDLIGLSVDAQGDFYTKEANIDGFGLNFNVYDTYMTLDNFKIDISQMFAKYKDIATSKVNAKFNAKSSIGKINFDLQSVKFDDQNITMLNKSLKLNYNINPKQDTINVAESKWKIYDKNVTLEKQKLPFNINTLDLKIPTTLLNIENIASLYLDGKTNLKTQKTNLDLEMLKFNYKDVTLSQTNAELSLRYDKSLSINMKEKTPFSFKGQVFNLENTSAIYHDGYLNILSDVDLEELGKTKLNLDYELDKNTGNISLKDTILRNKSQNIFSMSDSLDFSITYFDEILYIASSMIDLNFLLNKDEWILNSNSLTKLSKHSDLLQNLKLTNGSINFYQKITKPNIHYSASLLYPHKIMVINNIPVENYQLNGELNLENNTTTVDINDLIKIQIDDKIQINIQDVGIDINELLDVFDSNSSQENTIKDINLHAQDSFLYISKDRHVISDTIDLQYKEDLLTAQLKHKNAVADFKLSGDTFKLTGDDFNAKFMEELFALSKFRGGKLDFAMSGTTKKYSGVFYINNTIIKSYRVLNNVLAFVNTIPSLVTFSLPGYNKHGLKVKNAYMKFSAENDIFDISDIYLNSKEVDILGRGTTNFKNNTIDLELNLKTDLASAASKIPIVGYILFDDDSVSTSLSVKGKLTDPKVKSRLAKEIVVAPLNIIKRTLLYPYHLLSDINTSK